MNLHLEDRAGRLEKYGAAAEKITWMLQCTRFPDEQIRCENCRKFVWEPGKMRGDRMLLNISILLYIRCREIHRAQKLVSEMRNSTRHGL
ncbi:MULTISPECIES: hypothetical protein [unclassified Rhizobium]|uniref:hypothetical protein n=1 Tax=unclassified Rhizobium TaxID=2613769 RepID=UPI0012E3BC10|nr:MULTISPECIES: hypothetical protein [unclassified Rhizobium]